MNQPTNVEIALPNLLEDSEIHAERRTRQEPTMFFCSCDIEERLKGELGLWSEATFEWDIKDGEVLGARIKYPSANLPP
jgi:hypothetical protein